MSPHNHSLSVASHVTFSPTTAIRQTRCVWATTVANGDTSITSALGHITTHTQNVCKASLRVVQSHVQQQTSVLRMNVCVCARARVRSKMVGVGNSWGMQACHRVRKWWVLGHASMSPTTTHPLWRPHVTFPQRQSVKQDVCKCPESYHHMPATTHPQNVYESSHTCAHCNHT